MSKKEESGIISRFRARHLVGLWAISLRLRNEGMVKEKEVHGEGRNNECTFHCVELEMSETY